jgi:hypothetical protein
VNYPERVELIDGSAPAVPASATVSLISGDEAADGVFLVSDVSVRVPPGFAVLPTTGSIRVLTGPLAGTFNVQQIRPNRHHTRYVARRVS